MRRCKTSQEFIRFLNPLEKALPAGKVIHAILDSEADKHCPPNATHKHPKVLEWLADHPRWTFHFTPTSASWLNAVKTFFSALTRRALRRGVFKSVPDLQKTIRDYIKRRNAEPRPFSGQNPTTTFSQSSTNCLYRLYE